MIGNILRDREVQYVAAKDEVTNTWRILDTWSDALKTLNPDDDIPDDNAAVKILTEGEFISLVKEAARLGVLANAQFSSDTSEYDEAIAEKDEEIRDLNKQLREVEIVVKEPRSEAYDLKERAMESILKLVSMSDMTNLSRD